MLGKKEKRERRKKRVRAKIKGTKERPRLSVFRSSRHIYAQLIDDESGRTFVSASSRDIKSSAKKGAAKSASKVLEAREVGRLAAEKSIAKKIKKAVFDRGSYPYRGRIKAVAEGAREAGLEF